MTVEGHVTHVRGRATDAGDHVTGVMSRGGVQEGEGVAGMKRVEGMKEVGERKVRVDQPGHLAERSG